MTTVVKDSQAGVVDLILMHNANQISSFCSRVIQFVA